MTEKEKHVFPENWKKISNEESVKQLESLLKHYKEYNIRQISEDYIKIGDISIWKSSFGHPYNFYYAVNMQKVYDSRDKQFSLLEKLLDACKQEVIIRQQEKEKKRKKDNIRFYVLILTIILFLSAVSAKLLKDIELQIQEKSKKEKIINDQVKQYEQSLPNYDEYKQTQEKIANYRDSLQRESK